MTHPTQLRWTSASRTHVGMVREVNEDACLDQPSMGIWAVADGMGGHALGDFASHLVVDALTHVAPSEDMDRFVADARSRLQAANRQLRAEAMIRRAQIIGSTVVVLLARADRCGCLWAGDSRIYLFRNEKLSRLTRDHSQVEELVARGELTPAEAAVHPARNLITRAVGAAEMLEVDTHTMPVQDGDMFILCSDGLSNEVSEQQMQQALLAGDCEMAAATLLEAALKGGGRDNISVVVVRADDLQASDKTIVNPAV